MHEPPARSTPGVGLDLGLPWGVPISRGCLLRLEVCDGRGRLPQPALVSGLVNEIWRWNTATTVQHIRDRSVSAVEVAQAHLDRLDEVNPVLNAVTNDVRDEAMETARSLDDALTTEGPVGPLHGVPITIKENIDVAGQVTPNGMVAFADLVAPDDSPRPVCAQ